MSLKNFLKTIAYTFFKFLPSNGAVVLMYHSIDNNKEFFTISPANFEKQMAYLVSCKYNVISLSKFVDLAANHANFPSKTIVITIDDGYEDNYLNAWPILQKYSLPAAIFITTGTIGGERRLSNGAVLKMLSWEQAREMQVDKLVTFYPHTQNHKKLTSLSEAEIVEEIEQSRNLLASQLNSTTDIFAYPFGVFNDAVVRVVKQLGFRSALTVQHGIWHESDNLFIIPRNSIDSNVSFAMFKGIIHRGRL